MTQLANPSGKIPPHTFVQLTLLDLEKLEKRVTEGLAKFVEVGQALAEIQAREGYRLRNCKTFEEYCEKQFGFSLRHGQRLIAAAETATAVQQITGGDAPKNEATARVLSPLAKDEKVIKRVEAELKKSKKTFATATAEKIQEVVERVTGKTKPAANGDAKAAPQPTLFVAANPDKVRAAASHTECPNCHVTPNAYTRALDSFTCSNCAHPVALSVAVVVAAANCPECGKPITPDDDFCSECGAIL